METIPNIHTFFNFTGKVVVVTGSSRGIGKGIALRFAEAGANVIIHYQNNQHNAEEIVRQITERGGKASAIQANVAHPDEVQTILFKSIQQFEKIDMWINNAGIYPTISLLEMKETQWDDMLDANLKSVFLCTQAAARQMITQNNGGVIINIASIEGSFPAIDHSHYNASKAGVILYTQAAARELAPYNIRVNAVSPGLIYTPGIEENWAAGVNAWKSSVPIPRLGQPEDIADACLFLASPAARWITGINLIVDGGASTRPAF